MNCPKCNESMYGYTDYEYTVLDEDQSNFQISDEPTGHHWTCPVCSFVIDD